jgi:uncharacterized protein YecT (DUF1311 family)
MKESSRISVLFCFSLLAVATACRKESNAKETASVQQDTMLMRDLAEANRNTAAASAIDNSLNTVNTTGGGVSPSNLVENSRNHPADRVTAPGGSQVLTSGSRLTPPTQANDAPGRTTIPLDRSPASSASTRASRDPCESPDLNAQRYCLNRSIASNDADLNRTYQDLIDQAGKSGGSDLQDRFRQSQRDWINQRDSDCTSQTPSTEGKLWAKGRARCLSDYSAKRTAELQRNLSSLRGQ